jgi:hypothetical protein
VFRQFFLSVSVDSAHSFCRVSFPLCFSAYRCSYLLYYEELALRSISVMFIQCFLECSIFVMWWFEYILSQKNEIVTILLLICIELCHSVFSWRDFFLQMLRCWEWIGRILKFLKTSLTIKKTYNSSMSFVLKYDVLPEQCVPFITLCAVIR